MPTALSLTRVLNPNPGWYSGDFHCHTNFSDGHYEPVELVEVARREGLDFFWITDHNTFGAYEHFGDPDDVLVLPGMEVTFGPGHYNTFGIQEQGGWIKGICDGDWRVRELHGRTLAEVVGQTAAAGLLNSINHPLLEPWAWVNADTDLHCVHGMEIWNDPSWPDNRRANPAAVRLWTDLLNAGHRITAIGGSDFHRPEPAPGQDKPAERLGCPRTYVYARELSGAAVLAAVRQQRAYVSRGQRVSFAALAGAECYEIGADVGAASGPVSFVGTVAECPDGARVQIVCNGAPVAVYESSGGEVTIEWDMLARPDESAWVRLDTYDADGLMLAITNPIFFGPRPEPDRFYYGDFVDTGKLRNG